jgi:hypothetical protein
LPPPAQNVAPVLNNTVSDAMNTNQPHNFLGILYYTDTLNLNSFHLFKRQLLASALIQFGRAGSGFKDGF